MHPTKTKSRSSVSKIKLSIIISLATSLALLDSRRFDIYYLQVFKPRIDYFKRLKCQDWSANGARQLKIGRIGIGILIAARPSMKATLHKPVIALSISWRHANKERSEGKSPGKCGSLEWQAQLAQLAQSAKRSRFQSLSFYTEGCGRGVWVAQQESRNRSRRRLRYSHSHNENSYYVALWVYLSGSPAPISRQGCHWLETLQRKLAQPAPASKSKSEKRNLLSCLGPPALTFPYLTVFPLSAFVSSSPSNLRGRPSLLPSFGTTLIPGNRLFTPSGRYRPFFHLQKPR